MSQVYDVLILGGGPAGLSMATTLARQAYTALILDSNVYRNARATHMHNVPGFDHVPPADFRAKVRSDLMARYKSVEFRDATTIVEVRQRQSTTSGCEFCNADGGNTSTALEFKNDVVENIMAQNGSSSTVAALADAKFEARDAHGNVFYGKKLGIATGVRDRLEEQVDGYAECWGRGM
ncbi:hypothetical protein NQ176_g3073 [Zarea fungicola]|uniref:Uncharacterized protein n=1 Tax=Zarea fungicola TaxID=93591 RepID=A0ACC1NLF0_9HYPO|nr:hypothetical protein NQ176_g3073 [Lecanicillium fungicola]